MESNLEERKRYYYDIEREGRVISSVVAIITVLTSLVSTTYAVEILIASMSFDLIRCAYRKHGLDWSVVVHHLATILIGTVFVCNLTGFSDLVSGTTDLVRMELTNPFLHSMWIWSKHPQYKNHSQYSQPKTLAYCLCVLLWPYFRVWTSSRFALYLWSTQSIYGFFPWLAVTILASLQIVWFVKLLGQSVTRPNKWSLRFCVP